VLTIRTPNGLVPGFALALYAKARGLNLDSLLTASAQSGELDLPGVPARYRRVDRAAVQTVPITFEGPPSQSGSEEGAFRVFSSYAVQQLVSAGAPLPWMKDKLVLLGSGFHDSERFRSPFYDAKRKDGTLFGWTYGVEVHANALQNILAQRFLVPLPVPLVWLLLLSSSAVVTGVLFRYGVNWGVRVAAMVMIAVIALAIVVFQQSEVAVPMISPLIGVVLSFLGSTSYVSIVEGREKRLIRRMFGKYVSPRVVDELVADPSRLKLGGEKRHITILFSDLAGFTAMSERLEPEQLVSVLNQYLNEMSALAMEERGLIDKYIGDAIMALYGAPTALEDHALHACRTAVRMQRRLAEMNRAWQAQDPAWPPLDVRIGINTGTPVVGNIGGEDKFDYTALGDAVNLAARLEPACKTYGVGTMIAQPTREEAGARIHVRELDLLAVYGKTEPIRVYELIDIAESELPEDKRIVLHHYEQGLAAFRRRDFELAQEYFKAALEVDPADGPSALYLERCVEYAITPPPADWDFVERRQFK
jgi:adenylate cyclase